LQPNKEDENKIQENGREAPREGKNGSNNILSFAFEQVGAL
jgi:hypothetical protein